MATDWSTPVDPVHVRNTGLLASNTREQYREKLARITLDSMGHFVALLDAEGTVLEINQGSLNVVGINLSDVEGKPFWTTAWWQVSEEVKATLKESILQASQGEFVRWETVISWSVGGKESLIIDASLTPVRDEEGKVVFITVEGRDVTEKKAHEREMARQREELSQLALTELQMLYDQSPVGMLQLDADLRYVRINKILAEMNGIPAQEHIGKTVREVVPDLAPKLEEAFRKVIETGEPVLNIELVGETEADPGVQHTWLESWFPRLDSENNILGLNVVAQDITKRKRAEEALRAKQAELQLVTDYTPLILTRCSRDLRYLFVNRAAAALFGRTPEQMIGQPIRDIMGEQAFTRIKPRIDQVLQGERVEFEAQIPYSGVGLRWVNAVYVPDKDEKGMVIGWIASITDITERKEAEARAGLLAQLAEMVRNITNPDTFLFSVAETVGKHLQVQRSFFVEIDQANNRGLVRRDYSQGLPSVAGAYSLADYSPETSHDMRKGKTVVNSDSQLDPRTAAYYEKSYGPNGERAYVAVPLLRNGNWIAALWVSTDRPRDWRAGEVALLEAVAERAWLTVEKMQSEAALRESENKFSLLFQKAAFGAALAKLPEGTLLDVNEAFASMFGYTKQEAVGKNLLQLGINPDTEMQERVRTELEQHGFVRNWEMILHTKSGEARTFLNNLSVIELSGEKYLLTTLQDITKRKRVEQGLSELVRQQGALYSLADQLYRAHSLGDVFNAALEAILNALQCHRASILLFDSLSVMRFVAWRGLSDNYRKATEGHTPWKPDDVNAEPIAFNDIHTAELGDSLQAIIQGEGIRSLAFIPLVSNNKLIGKFMVYFDTPHIFSEGDLELSLNIARQLAFGIDRMRAEDALLTSEALYRTIAQSIPGGGVYVVDKDHRYVVAGGAVTEAFGLTRDMLEGHTVSEVFTPEQTARMEERFKRNLAGETVSYETQFNGRVFWTQQAPLASPPGHTIIVTIDITERKQVEEALRQSEQRFTQFMQYLPGLAWIKDLQGRYVFANAAAEKTFTTPQSHGKIYGKTDDELFPPEIANQFKQNDAQALADGAGVQVIETLKQEDGILHYSLVNKFPIPGPDGNPELIGGTAFDITERRKAEEDLIESEKRLKTLNETLEQKVKEQTAEVRRLATDLTKAEQRERQRIAHILHDDLQQRLYAIQMQIALLHGEFENDDNGEMQQNFADLKEQLDEIVAVTRNLSVDLSPPILHNEGMAEAIQWLSAQMREQYGLNVELQADGSFAIPDADLQVLLYNSVRELLFNIVKHAGVKQAVVVLQRSENDLRIEVRDSGKGFYAKAYPQNPSDKLEPPSSGFGIPTLRHQLSLFGGSLEIESEIGEGTRIKMTIPVYKEVKVIR